MSTYTYSLASDFGGSLKLGQFHDEVNAEGTISPSLTSVTLVGDVVSVTFNSALSGAEETTLDGLVSAHTPTNIGSQTINLAVETDDITDTTYHTVMVFNYLGSDSQTPTHIKVVSEMDDGGTSYDIRIMDVTNNNAVCTSNFTNTLAQVNDLGTLSNLPTNAAIFEVQIKVNGSTTANVREFVMYYD